MKTLHSSLIHSLLAVGCPTAILRRIRAFAVNPVEAHAFRSLPHVSEEVLKNKPALAHGNAPASIKLIRASLGVCTAISHGLPSSVNAGCGLTVSSTPITSSVLLQAATTSRKAASQIAQYDLCTPPAVTDTPPVRVARLALPSPFLSDQPSESLPGYVDGIVHAINYNHTLRVCNV